MKHIDPYTIAIVDDEEQSIELMTELLGNFSSIPLKVVGTANNLPDAVAMIKRVKPEFVFLDIKISGKSGLNIYEYFKVPEFKIIFMTAHEPYTLDAFKKSASDCLLKPINIVELKETI